MTECHMYNDYLYCLNIKTSITELRRCLMLLRKFKYLLDIETDKMNLFNVIMSAINDT